MQPQGGDKNKRSEQNRPSLTTTDYKTLQAVEVTAFRLFSSSQHPNKSGIYLDITFANECLSRD